MATPVYKFKDGAQVRYYVVTIYKPHGLDIVNVCFTLDRAIAFVAQNCGKGASIGEFFTSEKYPGSTELREASITQEWTKNKPIVGSVREMGGGYLLLPPWMEEV